MTPGEPDPLLAAVARDRATVWAALARAFYLPDTDLMWDLRERRIGGELDAAVRWLGPDAAVYRTILERLASIADELRSIEIDAALRALRVEHARLFTGPGRPAVRAFETEYVDAEELGPGRLNGPATSAVAAWYREFGLERAETHRDLPDFVATEFEFIYALARAEAAARLDGREDEARRLRRETDRFLREHPARWVPAFCQAVLDVDAHPVYAAFAQLAAVHLATELGENLDRQALPWPSAAGARNAR